MKRGVGQKAEGTVGERKVGREQRRKGGREEGRKEGRQGGKLLGRPLTTHTTVTLVFNFHILLLPICDLLEIEGHILFISVTPTQHISALNTNNFGSMNNSQDTVRQFQN